MRARKKARPKFWRVAEYLRRSSNGLAMLGHDTHTKIASACNRSEAEGARTRTRIHTKPRTRVNYVSCEMSNCSPYRKIYNSARCGKHYVLRASLLSPAPYRAPSRASASNLAITDLVHLFRIVASGWYFHSIILRIQISLFLVHFWSIVPWGFNSNWSLQQTNVKQILTRLVKLVR